MRARSGLGGLEVVDFLFRSGVLGRCPAPLDASGFIPSHLN